METDFKIGALRRHGASITRIERVERATRPQPPAAVRYSDLAHQDFLRPDLKGISNDDIKLFRSLLVDVLDVRKVVRFDISETEVGKREVPDSIAERIVNCLAHLGSVRGL